jgi:hypothetical protein
MSLTQLAADLWTVEHDQTLPGRFHMPTRMTVVRLHDHALWLHSPIPIGDSLADELEALGEVQYLVAPNRLHHLYLPRAQARYRESCKICAITWCWARRRRRSGATLSSRA